MQGYTHKVSRPSKAQLEFCRQAAGSARWVYNRCNELIGAWYRTAAVNHEAGTPELTPAFPSKYGLQSLLPGWKKEHEWLKVPIAQSLQVAVRDASLSWRRFKDKKDPAGKPKYRSRNRKVSFTIPQYIKYHQCDSNPAFGLVKLPKIGWLRVRGYRTPPLGAGQHPKRATVTVVGNNIYVSLVFQRPEDPAVKPGLALGVDLGVAQTITTSTGQVFQAPRMSEADIRHLRRCQRRVSRRVKGSARRRRAIGQLANFRARWARKLKDFNQKTSTQLVAENQGIVIEDLQVKNMTRKCKGRGRRAKAGLNRAILSQGWFQLRTMLEYKSRWHGKQLLAVSPAYTSQRCNSCGHVCRENRVSQSAFECVACGHTDNADTNAAKNILEAGWASTGRGEDVSPLVGKPTRGSFDEASISLRPVV